jgi:predicted nucleic acid-binding protein
MNVRKKARATEIVQSGGFGVSAQVMQELYSVAVRKADFKLSPAQALRWVELLEEFPWVPVTPSIIKRGAYLSERYRISYWDGAIVAAAEALGAPVLYSEDLSDGQTYGEVKAVNPFRDLQPGAGFHEPSRSIPTQSH